VVKVGSSDVDMISGPGPPHQFDPLVVEGKASVTSEVELGRELLVVVSSLTV
jgi:hypothetical protein